MSVTSATQVKLTATTAEPPKNTTPVQPWKATGPIYYHNEYVNRAADLGCCGVTRLLIVAENSLPNRIGKMALFAIVSFGFAMFDVIRAAWAKISGSRTVAPVTGSNPTTTKATASASTSKTEASSKPTATAKPQQTAAAVSTGETQEEGSTQTEPNPLPKEPPYDRKAIKGLTNHVATQTGMLASAIAHVQNVTGRKPSAAALTEAMMQVRKGANTAAKGFAERLSTNRAQLKETNRAMDTLQGNCESIQRQTHQFLTIAETQHSGIIQRVAPELCSGAAPETPPAQPHTKQIKPSKAPFLSPPTPTQQLSLKKLNIFREPSPTSSLLPTKEEMLKLREKVQHLSAQISTLAPKANISEDGVRKYLRDECEQTWELEVARLERGLDKIWGDIFRVRTDLLDEIHKIDNIQLPVTDQGISDEAWLAKLEEAIGARIDNAIQKRKKEITGFFAELGEAPAKWVYNPPSSWSHFQYIRELNALADSLRDEVIECVQDKASIQKLSTHLKKQVPDWVDKPNSMPNDMPIYRT